MQGRMWTALAGELDRRFGQPTWHEPHDYGATWATPTSTIGLFVGGNGGWIIETHELRTTGLVFALGLTVPLICEADVLIKIRPTPPPPPPPLPSPLRVIAAGRRCGRARTRRCHPAALYVP